jgi:hypothetical protein
VRGAIFAGGGGGEGGDDGVTGDNNIGAGGGGGSGGAVLLEAEDVVVESGGFVRANGGGGGGGAGCYGRGAAPDGTDGSDHATRPPGGDRGRSCVGGDNHGADGEDGGDRGAWGTNGGGGGGGAGCILIRSEGGTLPSGLSATSPMAAPGLSASMIDVE